MIIDSPVGGGERHEGSRFEVEQIWRDTVCDLRRDLRRKLMIAFPVGHSAAFAEVEGQMIGSLVPVRHPAIAESTSGREVRNDRFPIVN